jgi:hypothetical protein
MLNPCICDESGISCYGNHSLNLKHVFENITQNLGQNEKHFKRFFLNNTAITEIEENTFFEITFDEIYIYYAIKLKSINSHAFNSTNLVTKRFFSYYSPIVNSPPNYDLFLALSLFINLERLELYGTQISEIPSYAFRPIIGIQSKLSFIDFGVNNMKEIGNYSFYDLKNLTSLTFTYESLELISMNSFHFNNVSNQTFELHLNNIYSLNGSSFAINSLSNIERPTQIYLRSANHLEFFDETIFLPFLASNPENKILLNSTYIDCDDCRSNWLVKESKYLERFDQIICSNGNDIRNNSNFKNCND